MAVSSIGIPPSHNDPPLTHPQSTGPVGLLSQLFEIRSTLIDKGIVTFRVAGTCMYPTLQPGDVLEVVSRSSDAIVPGEIAVFRRDGRLFAHRAISAGTAGGRRYVRTRADDTGVGYDGDWFDEDIVGVVKRIYRNGRTLAPGQSPSARRLLDRLAVGAYWSKIRLIRKSAEVIDRLQGMGIYRAVAGRLFRRWAGKVVCSVLIPHGASKGRLSRRIDPSGLTERGAGLARRLSPEWGLECRVGGRFAGFLGFRKEGEWTIIDRRIRYRYGGTELDAIMMARAYEILARTGARRVVARLTEGDRHERSRLARLGFKSAGRGGVVAREIDRKDGGHG